MCLPHIHPAHLFSLHSASTSPRMHALVAFCFSIFQPKALLATQPGYRCHLGVTPQLPPSRGIFLKKHSTWFLGQFRGSWSFSLGSQMPLSLSSSLLFHYPIFLTLLSAVTSPIEYLHPNLCLRHCLWRI